jgi:hypothetical protein
MEITKLAKAIAAAVVAFAGTLLRIGHEPLARELIALQPDVLFAVTNTSMAALQEAQVACGTQEARLSQSNEFDGARLD